MYIDGVKPRRATWILVAALAAMAIFASPAGAASVARGDDLVAGVGRADITPQTEYYLGGFTRADRLGRGVHTRLYAHALVLQRGARKVALVSVELFAVPGGLAQQVAQMVSRHGFSERNVVISATHTHSGPGGYANFPTYNTAAPSTSTVTDPFSFARLLHPAPADVQLYTFLVKRIAIAIARADANRGPAVAGWGERQLVGLTQNRSLEAHLANFGIHEAFGTGNVSQAPGGYPETIDPNVDVLRVDKLVRRAGRLVRMPIGAWSNFANHGTVTKSLFQAYSGDHHATAIRAFDASVRRAGHVPPNQLVDNVYGNSDEGDQTAGIRYTGPAGADYVGQVEARSMLAAWRSAGRHLTRRPALELRWTRVCFCGQRVDGGAIDSKGVAGTPFFTGSEEERGPLFDVTHVPLEGKHLPIDYGVQGDKIQVPAGEFPRAAPLLVVRVGDHLIASLPGEATKQAGLRIKAAVLGASRSAGIHKVVIAGLANEYLQYVTTPAEYEAQHYEGGSTIFGELEEPFFEQQLAALARSLARGVAAPAPYAYDPTHGVVPDGVPYPAGAAHGAILVQPPAVVARLGHVTFSWQGGTLGRDRPLERPFITVQRQAGRHWRTVDTDLGLAMLWRVNDAGRYDAYWEVPLGQAPGRYRVVVSANRYRLVFRTFRLAAARSLTVVQQPASAGRVAVRLSYPPAVENVDLRYRPAAADGGSVRFRVGGITRTIRRGRGEVFSLSVPAGASVSIAAGGGRDRYGNLNGTATALH